MDPRLPDRFRSKIQVNEAGCWEWTAAKDWDGYGIFQFEGQARRAHRFAWKLLKGDLEPRLQLDHLCRNRACVNPEHLEQVTNTENVRRGLAVGNKWNVGKSYCVGSANGRAKLSEDQVLEIRRLKATTSMSNLALAAQFGVSNQLISYIVKRQGWKDL